jgi:SulP family sulfate permease
LAEEVSFFNKANLMDNLNKIKNGSNVVIDLSKNKYMAYDIKLLLDDFILNAKIKNINLKFIK